MDFKSLPDKVTIIEVGPRDGLQNESVLLETSLKTNFILDLKRAGLKTIEATSFVRAEKIPQMKDAADLFTSVRHLQDEGIHLPCLVPNLKGLEKAMEVGVREIAVFSATSDTFNRKNINATVEESLERLGPVIEEARRNKLLVRGYISTAFGCPYEGETSVETLSKVSQFLLNKGCYEISIGDTTGVAVPSKVHHTILALKKICSLDRVSMHFHDTRGMAIANSLTALDCGVTRFDSSAGGLGGCPYAKGASGNVATEDMVYLFHSMNIDTDIDMDLLTKTSLSILKSLNRETSSKFLKSYRPE